MPEASSIKTSAPKVTKASGQEKGPDCSIEFSIEVGADLQEAVQTYGKEAVRSCYLYGIRTRAGQYARNVLEDEVAKKCPGEALDGFAQLDQTEQENIIGEAVQACRDKMAEWKPDTKAPAARLTTETKVLREFSKAESREAKEALLEKLRAQLEAEDS